MKLSHSTSPRKTVLSFLLLISLCAFSVGVMGCTNKQIRTGERAVKNHQLSQDQLQRMIDRIDDALGGELPADKRERLERLKERAEEQLEEGEDIQDDIDDLSQGQASNKQLDSVSSSGSEYVANVGSLHGEVAMALNQSAFSYASGSGTSPTTALFDPAGTEYVRNIVEIGKIARSGVLVWTAEYQERLDKAVNGAIEFCTYVGPACNNLPKPRRP